MEKTLYINDTALPEPDGDLSFKPEKIKTELQTEAGTTQVIITRTGKLTVSGTWKLSGTWAKNFRDWDDADTVTVLCYWPDPDTLSSHECQFSISGENHITGARERGGASGGLYEISVDITEL